MDIKTYIFKIVIEPDDDRWYAYCPALEEYGAATWGYTREEALKNINEVVQMTIESLKSHNEPIPFLPEKNVTIESEPLVAVMV